ncbi:hypothetical protein ABIE59_002475 [Marinobacter sp. MBR-99]|uniref:hypothetical protein n=1 Tax=Marinobacter sp. MBR-99 TaxID=3156461 RepID=UPI003399DFEA
MASFPKIVDRGIHRLVTNTLSFGKLVPSNHDLAFYRRPNETYKVVDLLERELSLDLDDDLIKKIDSIVSKPMMLRFSSDSNSAEDFFWGNKATNNLVLKKVLSALAFGELEFWERDLPQNSHEERLTGHILSKIFSSVRFCSESISDYSKEVFKNELPIEVSYHDLSKNNREKVTGSDFGVILHTNFPDQEESVMGVAIQAKKLKDNLSYLPIAQADAQLKFAGTDGAYCCFYDVADTGERLPPAVLRSEPIVGQCETTKNDYKVQREMVSSSGLPLSLFLIWVLEGKCPSKKFDNIRQAANFMVTGDESVENYPGPSRVLTISIGGMSFRQELDDLKNLFTTRETGSPD